MACGTDQSNQVVVCWQINCISFVKTEAVDSVSKETDIPIFAHLQLDRVAYLVSQYGL